jgi:MinD-like ATPase involved in chromosome partitioning or flagellar assembly
MPDDTDDRDQPDQSLRDRRQAQSAAGDLSRMGIDPRSLGLGEPEPRTPPPAPAESADDVLEPQARVLPLRPEFNTPAPAPAEPIPVEDDAVRPPSAAEQLLSRASNPQPAPRQTSRLLRTVARGLTTPDAALTVQGEREAVDAIRHRQTDRRIVAFVAGKGGVGCTTIAVGVGTAFMAMREDHSVVVDVQQGTPSLGRTFGASDPRSVASLLSEVEAATPPAAPTGLGLVDGSGWDQGLTRSDVAGVLDRLRADHTFNLLDVGDDAGEAGHSALARADQAVVVTSPGELGVAALRAALDRIKVVNPQAASSAVHVVVCPHEQSYREAQREFAATLGVPIVVVPPDPYLQAGHAYDPAQVSPATREALLRVAGLVANRSVRP